MKIKEANLYFVNLPLKKPFKHAAYNRTYNQSIFLEIISDNTFNIYCGVASSSSINL
jgi:hypothetical protein